VVAAWGLVMLDKIEADAIALSGAMGDDEAEAVDRSRADVVKMLRDALERAERGEIIAIGLAVVHSDNAVATSFDTGHAAHGWARLLGASTLLTDRLVRHGDPS